MNYFKSFLVFAILLTSVETIAQQNSVSADNSKLYLDVNYGFGFRTAKAASSLGRIEKAIYNNIKKGGNLQLEVGYKFNPNSSVSLVYNRYGFKGRESSQSPFTIGSVNFGTGTWKTEGNIGFIGAKYNYHQFVFSGKGELTAGFGLGSLSYKSVDYLNTSIFSGRVNTKGNTLGYIVSASYYHFVINRSAAFGLKLGYVGGQLSKAEATTNGTTVEQKLNPKEGLGQLSINFGFRIFF